MKYAKEVMELMGAYPGRDFEMKHLVRYIKPGKIERSLGLAIRVGVLRVLNELNSSGTIEIKKATNGASAKYRWKS